MFSNAGRRFAFMGGGGGGGGGPEDKEQEVEINTYKMKEGSIRVG